MRNRLFFLSFTPRFIASQPAREYAMHHLDHFLFGRLPRNLEQ